MGGAAACGSHAQGDHIATHDDRFRGPGSRLERDSRAMRRTLVGLCLALGLASICVGSACLGSKLALERPAAGTLPVDLRSELEADYHGEEAAAYLAPLEPAVSEQAREDAAQLAVRFSWQDL